jgi:DNA-binding NtrC family response regulator
MPKQPQPKPDDTTLDGSSPKRPATRRPVLHVVCAAGAIVGDRRLSLRAEMVAGRQPPDGGWLLEDDGQASRRHARLTVHGERVSIEDLDSRNGISVNGERVERATLGDRDVIRVGSTFAVLRLEDPRQLDVPNRSLIGTSPEMRSVRVAVRRVAKNDATVLLLGETGSGKEVAARAIHDASRRTGRYVAVNCAGVQATLFESELFGHDAGAFTGAVKPSEGYFRAARDGTLLLDEVGDMPGPLQAKLLRALETRTVVPVGTTTPIPHRARVIAATNRDLQSQIDGGSFREDLFARLAQLTIALPPLRHRREDILRLLEHFYPELPPLATSLVEALLTYPWPRNVRELGGVAAELQTRADGAERLELDMTGDRLSIEREVESQTPEAPAPNRERLEDLLGVYDGNIAAVARAVGRSRAQVYRLLEQHGIDPTSYRAS